jgi:hypothetical protein
MAFLRNLVTRVGTSVAACLALTLSAATAAQAQTVSTGSLDLAAADGGVQQFFSAALAEEMSVTVSAAEGKIAVTTRDANNNVVQLGVAEPNDPLTVQGTYDDLYASIADPQGDPPKGGYSITFNEALARAEAGDRSAAAMIPENQAPTSSPARPATATPGASQPVPPVKAFNLTFFRAMVRSARPSQSTTRAGRRSGEPDLRRRQRAAARDSGRARKLYHHQVQSRRGHGGHRQRLGERQLHD